MKRLWAPWRKVYIRPRGPKKSGCVFCSLLKKNRDTRHYILKRSRYSFSVLNLYPYNNGHVLILPKRHIKYIAQMTDPEKLDWLDMCQRVQSALEKSMRPQGFNWGMNFGRTSGAGVPGHLHMHVVPRWNGDTNFMQVLGETKVISESLASVYRELKAKLP
ncbi:MAG: HIT domain-containing protein [Candidatus Omnitrophota bacterium]|nr:HIT domain-containing protein [Candidatus Omnitrophota bacterium]